MILAIDRNFLLIKMMDFYGRMKTLITHHGFQQEPWPVIAAYTYLSAFFLTFSSGHFNLKASTWNQWLACFLESEV